MVSFNKCKEILKTLPIGYYLGNSIECELSEGDKSYHDPMNNKIVIGYKQLPLDDLEEDDLEVEDNVRCMLYHEISHAILTPRMKMTDWLNIFEDQRIETLLKDFFHRVDFEGFVKKVNDYEAGKPAESAREYYYNIIRFGEGPEKFVIRRDNIIYKYSNIIKTTPSYDTYYYIEEVKKLYDDIVKDFEEAHKDDMGAPEKSDGENSEGPSSGETSSEKIDGESDGTNKEMTEGTALTSKEESEEKSEDEASIASEVEETPTPLTKEEVEKILKEFKKILTEMLDKYNNKKLTANIKGMIDNAQRKKRNQASSINGYSGKLNPKMINRQGKVENYKWWQKPSQQGEANRFDKIQLNLFCDVSGSFGGSEYTINEIIKSLLNIEKLNKDFTFKLIKMGNENKIAKDNERFVRCQEGNYLTNDILDIYKKVQTPMTTIYNIVVFDGDAQSFDGCSRSQRTEMRHQHERAWGAWNHSNCVIISDPSNQREFDKHSPNAKRIYTYSYTAELEQNIIKSLGLLLK